jgi:hypothetical protein
MNICKVSLGVLSCDYPQTVPIQILFEGTCGFTQVNGATVARIKRFRLCLELGVVLHISNFISLCTKADGNLEITKEGNSKQYKTKENGYLRE